MCDENQGHLSDLSNGPFDDTVFGSEERISIKVHDYNDLLEDQKILNALRNAGVDNWEGFEIAMEEFEDD